MPIFSISMIVCRLCILLPYDLIHIDIIGLMHVNSTTHHNFKPHNKTCHLMALYDIEHSSRWHHSAVIHWTIPDSPCTS